MLLPSIALLAAAIAAAPEYKLPTRTIPECTQGALTVWDYNPPTPNVDRYGQTSMALSSSLPDDTHDALTAPLWDLASAEDRAVRFCWAGSQLWYFLTDKGPEE